MSSSKIFPEQCKTVNAYTKSYRRPHDQGGKWDVYNNIAVDNIELSVTTGNDTQNYIDFINLNAYTLKMIDSRFSNLTKTIQSLQGQVTTLTNNLSELREAMTLRPDSTEVQQAKTRFEHNQITLNLNQNPI